ncbi:MAG: glycosyltransferase [Prevotella sp.]|jgi:glycosyltransferase involved in cell wall biosynthesis|nr:glycosyltransferase [Prevotella sp.]MBR4369078.1 glycosyltransferase [Prevotella sp.]MBR7049246.1 glycosyltransferase [Prevotella sp.]
MSTQQTHTQDKMNKPLISFIITYYNLPLDYLKKCIDSILALSLSSEEREIILVDDGSDTSPINELKAYCDQIIYLRQTNQGLSVARNTGISIAKGDFIQFVDGDDYLNRSAYEHCLDIVRFNDVDVVLFQSSHRVGNNQQTVFNDSPKPMTGTEYMRNNNLRVAAWGYLFCRTLLMSLRFTPDTLHEDEEFTPQLFLRAEKIIETSAVAYFYRKRDNSIIHNKDKKWIIKRLSDTENIIYKLSLLADRSPEKDRSALQRRVAQLTMDYLYNTIVLTKSEVHLNKAIEKLHQKGLFPLPDKNYTKKYVWFRRLLNNATGRKLLLRILPLKRR